MKKKILFVVAVLTATLVQAKNKSHYRDKRTSP